MIKTVCTNIFTIPLNGNHLILTGANGSGKSWLLEEIYRTLKYNQTTEVKVTLDDTTSKVELIGNSRRQKSRFLPSEMRELVKEFFGNGYNPNSDGCKSIVGIVADLCLMPDTTVVMIDDIESHLHIKLQKTVLPFLQATFPNIQFVVTTHSPFVVQSISNAVICDLETKEVIADLSGYSYTALVESYFDSDKYSKELAGKVARFQNAEFDSDEYKELVSYFDDLPKFHADELAVEIQRIKLLNLGRS